MMFSETNQDSKLLLSQLRFLTRQMLSVYPLDASDFTSTVICPYLKTIAENLY